MSAAFFKNGFAARYFLKRYFSGANDGVPVIATGTHFAKNYFSRNYFPAAYFINGAFVDAETVQVSANDAWPIPLVESATVQTPERMPAVDELGFSWTESTPSIVVRLAREESFEVWDDKAYIIKRVTSGDSWAMWAEVGTVGEVIPKASREIVVLFGRETASVYDVPYHQDKDHDGIAEPGGFYRDIDR